MRHEFLTRHWACASIVATLLALIVAQSFHNRGIVVTRKSEMVVALPIPAQLALATGDRYLAANLSVLRAIVVGTHQLMPETYEVLAKVQSDAAFLNPAHEDNYYIAQAVLPWNGRVVETQYILTEAARVRLDDDLPPFFYGFNKMHFEADPIEGAKALETAAKRSKSNSDVLTNIAAAWYARGRDSAMAIGFVRALADRVKNNPGLKAHLQSRLARLEALQRIEGTVQQFRERFGVWPRSLDELVEKGLLDRLPDDPWGKGFVLKSDGSVHFAGKET